MLSNHMSLGCRGILLLITLTFTFHAMAQTSPSRRDINAVLAAHDKELLAIPGVTGVYVGVLADKQTPCLKVMLVRRTPEAAERIPKQLEGYPVVTEVTGEIRPLASP